MSTYLKKDEILSSELVTSDVEAFGGTVLVSELPADVVQRWFNSGVIIAREGSSGAELDFSKIDMIGVATAVIVDPETLEPMFTRKEVKELAKKSWAGVQVCAQEAIAITNWGEVEEEEAKN